MGEHAVPDPIAEGTILQAGDPTPPTTTAKANAGLWYGLVPVIAGAILTILESSDVLFPDSDSAVKQIIPVVLLLLGPVASYFGVKRTPNLLKQPVQVLADTPVPRGE